MALIAGWGGRVMARPFSEETGPGAWTYLPVGRWQLSVAGEPVDATVIRRTEDPRSHERIVSPVRSWLSGYQDIEATFDCYYDSAIETFDAVDQDRGACLLPGQYISLALIVWVSTSDNQQSNTGWQLDDFLITRVLADQDVRGVARYTVTGKQCGGAGFVPCVLHHYLTLD